MSGSTDRPVPHGPSAISAALRRIRRYRPSERMLFDCVYGTVLASSLAAALDRVNSPSKPGYNAAWLLVSALVAAMAHGYAHAIAFRAPAGEAAPTHTIRTMFGEWPLVVATFPTVAALLTAYAGWWHEYTAVDVVLVFNVVMLFGWGAWGSRSSGGSWGAACRAGCVDMLMGLVIIAANVLIK
ncbi:hypothetical protein [Streptosporangium sp. NPDC000396]|uniref:hypothetical protein n=1 Tax=Streptosporangium sp. NPDC000396 TaxID=3366185 RepID=UPI0036A5CA3F